MRSLFAFLVACSVGPAVAEAASIAPPMFDIARQCNVSSRHNVTAMSECVVAESEARSDLLQHWDKLSDDATEKCIKLGRRSKRFPYVAMEKCLSADLSAAPASTPVTDIKK